MPYDFWVPYAASFSWIALVVASVVHRKAKSKPLRMVAPVNSLFVERWTSGRSLRNFVSRIGGARNCLFLAVTPDELIICPHFPFNLFFLPEMYGLDVVVPRSAVRSVELRSGIFGSSVLLSIDRSPSETFQFELRLKAPAEFVQAMRM